MEILFRLSLFTFFSSSWIHSTFCAIPFVFHTQIAIFHLQLGFFGETVLIELNYKYWCFFLLQNPASIGLRITQPLWSVVSIFEKFMQRKISSNRICWSLLRSFVSESWNQQQQKFNTNWCALHIMLRSNTMLLHGNNNNTKNLFTLKINNKKFRLTLFF